MTADRLKTYNVDFAVNAVVGVSVKAVNKDEAIEKAEKTLGRGIFRDGVEYRDGRKWPISVSIDGGWSVVYDGESDSL